VKTVLILEFLAFCVFLAASLLRDRRTGRSALYRLALVVSKGLRWLAAFVSAVATVTDELRVWNRIGCELRIQLAQDSFEAAELERES